ncbi:MAG: hypothetical protein AB7H93_08190 [Vicinamibacterales bacterium]
MSGRVFAAVLAVAAAVAGGAPPAARTADSHAIGLWQPHPVHDTCSAAYHDAFSVVGRDGKRYPTWHPPEGVERGAPCTFGHEHGRDPRGSALFADVDTQYGGVLFGFANERLDEYNGGRRIGDGRRHEDHVGHKIEWENDVEVFESVTNGGANRRALAIRCDFLMKIHQGTHSPDAFTNNLHELLYAAQCRDRADGRVGTKLIAYTMVQFGEPGGFSEGGVAGGFAFVKVGPAAPTRSPAGNGLRSIPTIGRVATAVLVAPGQGSDYSAGLYEDWISANYLRRSGAREALAYFDPHFAVFLPARFHWPVRTPETVALERAAGDVSAQLGRTIDLCYASVGARRAAGGECARLPGDARIAWDDPRSPFDGVKREFYFNQTTIVNAGNPTTWYTDPFGGQASLRPFPGAIAQYIAAVDNRTRNDAGVISVGGRVFPFESRAFGKDRWYGGKGVHAPN